MLSLIILIATVSINTLLILFISIKKRSSFDLSLTAFIFGLACLILWSVTNYLADNAPIESALFWTRATFPASLFMVWLIAWFSFAFPEKIFNYRLLNTVFFLAAVSASIASMTSMAIVSVEVEPGIGISDVVLGPAYPFIIFTYLALIIAIIFNLFFKYRRFSGIKKMQVSYVILGWSIFIAGAMTTSLILPYITGNADWSKFGPLMSIIMASSTAYAIVRYKFLDIRLVIQQGLVYTFLVILIGITYFLIAYLSGLFFSRTAGIQYSLSAYITTMIGIFGIPVLKKIFDRYTDKVFFKDKYDFSEAVYSLSRILNENLNLDRLKKDICGKLKRLMKLEYINILLHEDIAKNPDYKKMSETLWPLANSEDLVFFAWEIKAKFGESASKEQAKQLEKFRNYSEKRGIKLFVVLKIGKKPIGIISIGPKKSREMFSSDDIKLLKNLGYQMAVAIEKARLYKDIKNYSANLERKVDERTETIANLQKEQKQTILDIAHGLQTPITVIKGELNLLQKNNPDNQGFYAFEKSIDRISQLISDLLLLAQLERGDDAQDLEKIDLSSLLDDLAEYFEIVMRNKKIKLEKDIKPDIFILGKADKIEEMINSFVSNSMKYIGRGNLISLNLHEVRNQAVLTIKDDGIGIDPEEIPLLTKRFYRAKDNDKKGSGLGLAIYQKIIDLHKGKLEIRSEKGRGTEMIISFKTAR